MTARTLAPTLVAAVIAAAVTACGSRGPLDIEVVAASDADGGVDATTDATSDAASPDARSDARPGSDGGSIVNCGACVAQSCGAQFFQCLQSPACRTTFQCVLQDCLTGGAPNASCVLKCAGSDPTGVVQVLRIFTCVTQSCGDDCSSLLGGLGGGGLPGGGTGGGTGGGRPGGEPLDRARTRAACEAFSRWPELLPPTESTPGEAAPR